MKLWRKRKKADRELPSFVKTGLESFNGKLIDIANSLQQKTNGYSVRKKKVLLALFVVVFATGCFVVTIQSINMGNKTISVSRIKTLPIQNEENYTPIIIKSEFLRIQRFKNYADSLNTTRAGRKIRDSLLRNRPHLMDSVNFLINLYLEQQKTK